MTSFRARRVASSALKYSVSSSISAKEKSVEVEADAPEHGARRDAPRQRQLFEHEIAEVVADGHAASLSRPGRERAEHAGDIGADLGDRVAAFLHQDRRKSETGETGRSGDSDRSRA